MSCILHIETSTEACSVAVSEDGLAVFSKEDLKGPSHAVQLGVFVDEALSFVDSHGMPLDAVAVSCGPGSYTGLRIGVSMAKGICYGRNLPLIGLPTLEVLCVPVLLHHDLPEDALLCPMIDARRMEVYAAVYDRALSVKKGIAADIVDEHSYLEFLNEHPVYFFGNGAAKCRGQITHPNAHFHAHPFYARATLAYFPQCDRKQGVDYTSTEMDIHFGRVVAKRGSTMIKAIDDNRQSEEKQITLYEEDARKMYRKWDNVKHISEEIKEKRVTPKGL